MYLFIILLLLKYSLFPLGLIYTEYLALYSNTNIIYKDSYISEYQTTLGSNISQRFYIISWCWFILSSLLLLFIHFSFFSFLITIITALLLYYQYPFYFQQHAFYSFLLLFIHLCYSLQQEQYILSILTLLLGYGFQYTPLRIMKKYNLGYGFIERFYFLCFLCSNMLNESLEFYKTIDKNH